MEATTVAQPVERKLLTAEQIADLQGRVLRNEAVTDDELKLGLDSLAALRANGASASAAKKAAATPYTPKGSLADRMAAFKSNMTKAQ